MPREIPLDTASGPPRNGREIPLDTAGGAGPKKKTLFDYGVDLAKDVGAGFVKPAVDYGKGVVRDTKDLNEGLGEMVSGAGEVASGAAHLDPAKYAGGVKRMATGGGQALKGDVMSLLNDFGLVALPINAPLHAVSDPIKKRTGGAIDLEAATAAALPEKGAQLGAAELASNLSRAEPVLGRALNGLQPAMRAAQRFLKAAPAEATLAKAKAARAAGIEPTVTGVIGRPGLRVARTAKVVSPNAEEAINEGAEVSREQIAHTAAERIRSEAPHGHETVAEAKARLSREQDALAREQFREPYSQEVDVPDVVLDITKTPKTQAEIKSVIDTEVERAAHPEKYPQAPQNAQQLRDLATYNQRKAEWEAAKDKFDKEQAAYEAEAKKIGAESGKANAKYEKDVARAKAAHEKATAQWEARKAAHDKRSFSQDDFTGKIKTNDLAYLNKADVLNAKEGSGTAQVRDAMFETYGYKPRKPFDEPAPVLELPKKPKAVADLKAPEHPGPPPSRPRVSGAALDVLRQGLRDRGRALYDTDRALGGALGEHAKAIDTALDGPGFEHLGGARATYREFEARKALLDIPAETLMSSPGNFRVAVNKALNGQKMTPQMRADLTHALMSGLAEQAGRDPAGARRVGLKFLRGSNFRQNVEPLLGTENAERVRLAMRNVVDELEGMDYVLRGSNTADKNADVLREGVDASRGVVEMAKGNLLGALHSFGRVIHRRFTNMSEAEAQEVAKFFADGRTPEEVYAGIDKLLKGNTIPPNAPPRIKAILTRAIGAHAVSRIGGAQAFNPTQPQK